MAENEQSQKATDDPPAFEVTFWGVRGSLPAPGPRTLRYGGNTSCVTLAIEGEPLFILDAGTGIKQLSRTLVAEGRAQGFSARILITHPHWDHINALPFFAPFYMAGNDFEVFGARNGEITVRDTVSAQMDGVYFPVTIKEFAAHMSFHDLQEGTIQLGKVSVGTMLLNHPGKTLRYRFDLRGRRVCYITDNELYLPDNPKRDEGYVDMLAEFCRGADVMIADTMYRDHEYPAKVSWGHSCPSQVADLAHRANVKGLYLFHHDPDQDDDAVDLKLGETEAHLERLGADTVCVCPAEGLTVRL